MFQESLRISRGWSLPVNNSRTEGHFPTTTSRRVRSPPVTHYWWIRGPTHWPSFLWFHSGFQEKMSKYWVSSYIPVSSHDLENMDLVHAINGSSKSFVKMSCTTFWKTTLIRWIEKQRNHRFLKILGSKRFWQIIDLLNLMHKWNCRKIDFKPCWLKPYS